MSETQLLQFQLGVCACVVLAYVHPCAHPDLSGPKLVYLCMDFKILWHSCCPRGVEVPFETLIQVG